MSKRVHLFKHDSTINEYRRDSPNEKEKENSTNDNDNDRTHNEQEQNWLLGNINE